MLKQHDVVSEKVHILQAMTPQKTTCNQTMKTPKRNINTHTHTTRSFAHRSQPNAEQMVYVILRFYIGATKNTNVFL